MTQRTLRPGITVGYWSLLKLVRILTAKGKLVPYYQATCECSPTIVRMVSENSLRRTGVGQSRSCGCGPRLPEGEAALRLGHRQYKRHCARHGRPSPTLAEYAKLANTPPLTEVTGRKRKGGGDQPYISPPSLLASSKAIDIARGYGKGSKSSLLSEAIPSSPSWSAKKTARVEKLVAQLNRAGLVLRFAVLG